MKIRGILPEEISGDSPKRDFWRKEEGNRELLGECVQEFLWGIFRSFVWKLLKEFLLETPIEVTSGNFPGAISVIPPGVSFREFT